MIAKISKYAFEIIAGIAIFVAIIYFLPSNKVEIPDIGDLALSGIELEFVMEEEQVWIVNPDDIGTGDDLSIPEEWEQVMDSELLLVDTDISEEIVTEDNSGAVSEPLEDVVITEQNTMDIRPIVMNGKDPEPTAPVQPTSSSQQSCTVPRWGTIRHGESVLAYQQRSDDPGTCNIQRRVCNDGTLNGSYTQSSCRELMGFNVQRQEVVTYNVPSNNPYIQPTPVNNTNTSSSNFSATIPSTSQWWGTSAGSPLQVNRDPRTISTSTSTVRDGTVCTAPRGETVRNGQFVKAYRFDRWFSNMPCEVQLRYCVQTNLEWSFAYQSCQHYDIAVEDYMIGHYDPNVPSLQQLAEILHGSADAMPADYGQKPSLWDRVKWFVGKLF
jgi:hypothetical protein